MDEWISVKDWLPRMGEDVLVCYGNGSIGIDWMNNFRCFMFDKFFGQVTHWMLLPNAPEEDDNG